MRSDRREGRIRMLITLAGLSVGLGACSSPLGSAREGDLRRSVIEAVRTELADAELRPEERVALRSSDPIPIKEEFRQELEEMAGPLYRDFESLDYGEDLMSIEARTVGVSLEHAIRSAVNNNLEVQFARLAPAISESDVIAAEAAFDWVFFSNLDWTNQDQISPTTSFGLTAGQDQRRVTRNTTGIRRPLESGGQFSLQQELIYTDFETAGQTFTPDPAAQAAVTLQFDQPLLRNFGSDVSLAQVRINRNAERDSIARLRLRLIQTINQTEGSYWNLVRAHHDLAILAKLLDRGLLTRDRLQARSDAELDVPPSQLADAVARVERRKIEVIRARTAVREASDALKVLMNDPNLPVGAEILIEPLDAPIDETLSYSLLDALTTAVQHRPEIDQAILSIDNASIRQVVADNQRLPQLDLQVQTRFSAIDNDLSVYDDVFDGNFVDYIVGLAFEQPIGNRAAEATYVRRSLERQQASISYRNTVQQVVREVKSTLRSVLDAYRIIEQSRNARYTAAESLRALQVENELIQAMSSERLELEFNRQEALANAERQEMEAVTNFNASIAALYAAMGVSLEHNRIDLVVPTANEAFGRPRSATLLDRWVTPGSGGPGADPESPPAVVTEPEADG